MTLFAVHAGASDFVALAQQNLSARRARRLFSHLERCERCRAHWDRALLTLRLLERSRLDAPSDAELAALTAANREGALAVAGSRRPKAFWIALPFLAAVATLLFVLTAQPALVARGGATASGALLRVFCSGAGPLRELHERDACPSTGTLAFSARAPRSAFYVALRLRAPGFERRVDAQPVKPDEELPLLVTETLGDVRGELELEAAFGSTAEDANFAVRQGGSTVLRQHFQVQTPR